DSIENLHQWNSLIITSIKNPGLTGVENRHQFYLDYDRAWYNKWDEGSPRNDYRNNYNVGYDLVLKTFQKKDAVADENHPYKDLRKFKISAGCYFSSLSRGYLHENTLGLTGAFSYLFREGEQLSVGVSFLGVSIKTIDYSYLQAGNQFDG